MKQYVISAGDLSVTVAVKPNGLTLHSVTDRKSRRVFLRGDEPLLTLNARKLQPADEKTEEFLAVTTESGWQTVAACGSGRVHTLTLSDHAELPDVTLILTAVTDEQASKIAWTVRLDSRNTAYALYECDYPILSFGACNRTKVFFPYGCGEVYAAQKPFKTRQNYPSYGASMQYMALWHEGVKRGLYYGLHDPAPAYKKLQFCKTAEQKNAFVKAVMPLRDIDMPCNSQTLEGETVWQLFDGDWYDAAMLYRAFFETHASWKPVMKDGKRADLPEWLRTNAHWWRKRMLWDEGFADELLKADKDLGVPGPVHLYDWFQIPYDTNYPHYFPAKDAFLPGIRRLQKNGIRVMPYINGRLWDTHDKGKEDWQFTPLARPNCTKKQGDQPFLEVYPTSQIELAIMCPSTALWQEKMKEITNTLFNECKVDAIYLDQIGAAQAYPCEDRSHPHRAGGGTWWVESYRDLLGHVHRIMPPDGFLSTECTSDPYMKQIQAYLSWIWIKNNQVPAFMAIYNGYVAVFGRCYDYAGDAIGQDIFAAQSLTFGEQMGWIKPEVYQKLHHKNFYKACVRARAEKGDFFYDGKLLRSPAIADTHRMRTTKITFEAYGGLLEHTATFSELWERKDGKKLLWLVNASGRSASPTLTVEQGVLPNGTYTLAGELSGTQVQVQDGVLTVTLPPRSVSWLEF